MSLVESLRSAVDSRCITKKCQDGGCQVSLADMPSTRVIVNLESPYAPGDSSRSHCDYLVAYERNDPNSNGLVALELKVSIDASKALAQLQEGADVAATLLASVVVDSFVPVVAGTAHPHQDRELKRSTVRFRGQQLRIKTIRCRGLLRQALNSTG